MKSALAHLALSVAILVVLLDIGRWIELTMGVGYAIIYALAVAGIVVGLVARAVEAPE